MKWLGDKALFGQEPSHKKGQGRMRRLERKLKVASEVWKGHKESQKRREKESTMLNTSVESAQILTKDCPSEVYCSNIYKAKLYISLIPTIEKCH